MFTTVEYVILGAYVALILGIGLFFSGKGSENIDEYFLGGKSLPWWVLGISFMTSNLDLTGTMVIASFFAMVGLKGFLVELRGGTCLPLALFMIFIAKWHRRAQVMTMAEWMEFRFGTGRGAAAARLVSAIALVLIVIGAMTYFCVGFGKFLSLYLPWSPLTCATLFTAIATAHILGSGLYGVAFTDVIQGVMILFTVLYISVLAFAQADMSKVHEAWTALGVPSMTWESWTSITPAWRMEFPAAYERYNGFGVLLFFWISRIFLEGFGGPLVPYATQRFFAARDDRDASLTTASSLALFVVRWPLIIGVALLGLSLGSEIPSDPEMIFPAVLGAHFGFGVRAVIVSCMIAAAMSTFDSTVNAGGAYIVNDIYRRFIKPDASPKALVRMSWISTIVLTAAGVALSTLADSINQIWSWLSMGLFGGLAGPLVLRWYWERFNGWGYAIGTVIGIIGAVVQQALLPNAVEWAQLGFVGAVGLVGSIAATLLTEPTEEETLVAFYRRTRPIGGWPRARAATAAAEVRSIVAENRRDLISIAPAVALFFALFLAPMYLILHAWVPMLFSLGVVAFCAVILNRTWYRPLSAAVQ